MCSSSVWLPSIEEELKESKEKIGSGVRAVDLNASASKKYFSPPQSPSLSVSVATIMYIKSLKSRVLDTHPFQQQKIGGTSSFSSIQFF